MLTFSRALLWFSAAAFAVGAAVLWPDLPARIPTHFDAVGQPDAWSETSVLFWFGLPVLAIGLGGLMDWSAQAIRRRPESPLVNLPYKRQILALPAGQRSRVLGWQASAMCLSGVAVVASLALVQAGIWRSAHGADGATLVNVGVGVAVVIPLAAVWWASAKAKAVVERGALTEPSPR